MKIEIDLPELEGFEYTGEYRKPNDGEYHYCEVRESAHCDSIRLLHDKTPSLILRKLEPKRKFKDGAFYPVRVEHDIRKGQFFCHVAECSVDGSSIIFWPTQCNENYELKDFSWIGEEIKIEWGE